MTIWRRCGARPCGRGHVLRLGDLATVESGYEDPPSFLIRNGGEPSLVLAVVMRRG